MAKNFFMLLHFLQIYHVDIISLEIPILLDI